MHNERGHEAWMSGIDHIRATPGFDEWEWPQPMSLEEYRKDRGEHAHEFRDHEGPTCSTLEGDEVIGCAHIWITGCDSAPVPPTDPGLTRTYLRRIYTV